MHLCYVSLSIIQFDTALAVPELAKHPTAMCTIEYCILKYSCNTVEYDVYVMYDVQY